MNEIVIVGAGERRDKKMINEIIKFMSKMTDYQGVSRYSYYSIYEHNELRVT